MSGPDLTNGTGGGHDELQSLLGVYALDALGDAERRAVERHLEGCDECRAEVAAHLEVASALSSLSIASPPPALWDRIVDGLDGAGDLGQLGELGALDRVDDRPRPIAPPPLGAAAPPRADDNVVALHGRSHATRTTRTTRTTRAVALVAAAAAIIAVLSIGWVRANQRADVASDLASRPPIEQAADQALADPRSTTLELRSATGDTAATAVVTPSGDGYLLPKDLEPVAADRTYQLWQIGDRGPVSIGVLGNQPGVTGFHVQGPVQTLAITKEQAGGVPAPSGAPLASATA